MRGGLWLSAVAIFLSAFLLFALEPLIAKRILPWFGGSAAVWSTCLVFYQLALLLGYLYARLLTTKLSAPAQALVHSSLLLVSLVILPIGPGLQWQNFGTAQPTALIFGMLTATIGLPFVLLSATSPLLQHWLAQRGYPAPYWLFAVSNFASLGALLSYPLFIEPNSDIHVQRLAWSGIYLAFALVCGEVARSSRTHNPAETIASLTISPLRRALWFALAACGSMLLLSITNHITQNVAAVPLLWVLPLAIYLLTFIISFGPRPIYKRAFWSRVLVMALGLIAYAIYDIQVVEAIQISLPIFLFALFAGCMFCHGELNALRPEPQQLTDFYLWIAAGGAAGAVFVGLIAPVIFSGIYELPFSLVFTAALAIAVTWEERSWPTRALWSGVTVAMVAIFVVIVQGYRQHSLVLERSFYGSLRVVDTPLITEQQTRSLFHGTIKHGEEFLWPTLRNRPTTYYGPDSGIGILLRDCYPAVKSVGVIGLGTGTIAAYGRPGDHFVFFEINQQVVNIAKGLFYYLRNSKADTSIQTGDGRLLLQHDTSARFDVLALDAFSGDAVPVHLLTREAFALYTRHLNANGTIAFHVSSQYLDLASVVRQLADEAGYSSILARNHEDLETGVDAADWVLVTHDSAVLQNPAVQVHAVPIAEAKNRRVWTDGYNNLLDVFRKPEIK